MAEKKLIKERIQATEKTYQITSAMNMVSTAKLKRTERILVGFRPISDEVNETMSSLLLANPEISSPALLPNNGTPCFVLVASDRGLIGSYNNSIFRYFEEYLKEHQLKNDDYIVATIGYKAYSYAKRRKYHLLNKEAVSVRDDVLFADFSDLSEQMVNGYISGLIGTTIVFYTEFINSFSSKVATMQVLPIAVEKSEETNNQTEFIYEPDKDTVLNELTKLRVSYTIFRIILEAKTSEHASRMNAMKNASDNAKDIEEKLVLLYNHARQNQITTELTDIINGSDAVK